MITNLNIIIALLKHSFNKVIRMPVTLTFSFVQPMMWMLFFGFLFYRFPIDTLEGGISYIDFLLPGICGMTILFGASQSGVAIIKDIQTGFLYRMLRTPANRSSMLFGKILADILRLLLQAVVICFLGVLVGATLDINWLGVLLGFAALAFFALLYTSISCFIAIRAKEPEVMATFIHVVNMPILFTSTALVPIKQMPDWLSSIAQWNPLSIVVNCFRESLIYDRIYANTSGLFLLITLALILFSLASFSFQNLKME